MGGTFSSLSTRKKKKRLPDDASTSNATEGFPVQETQAAENQADMSITIEEKLLFKSEEGTTWNTSSIPDVFDAVDTAKTRLTTRSNDRSSSGYGSLQQRSTIEYNPLSKDDLRVTMALRRNYRYLLNETDAQYLINDFVKEDIVDEDDYQQVMNARSCFQRNEIFYQKILLHSIYDPKVVENLNTALKRAGYHFVVQKLNSSVPFHEDKTILMEMDAHTKFENHRTTIIKNLRKPGKVLPFFMESDLLDLDEYEAIFVKSTRKEKATALVEAIGKKLPKSFSVLLRALEVTKEDSLLKTIISEVPTCRDWPTESNTRTCDVEVNCIGGESFDLPDPGGISTAAVRIELLKYNKEQTQLERDLKRYMNTEATQVRELIRESADAFFSEASSGSLILNLDIYSQVAVKKLFHLCKSGGLKTLLERLFGLGCVSTCLPPGTMDIRVRIDTTAYPPWDVDNPVAEQESYLTQRESILRHFDYLIDEIEPLLLLERPEVLELMLPEERAVIKQQEFKRYRADSFLKTMLSKSDKDVDTFAECLKQEYPYIRQITGMKTNIVDGDILDIRQAILDNVTLLVDEIDVQSMKRTFVREKIFTVEFFEKLMHRCESQREEEALELIYAVLKSSDSAVLTLLEALFENGNHEVLAEIKASTYRCRKAKHETNHIEGVYEDIDKQVFDGQFEICVRKLPSGRYSSMQNEFEGETRQYVGPKLFSNCGIALKIFGEDCMKKSQAIL